jgi:hypothetical protein
MRLLSGQVSRRKVKLALEKLPEKLGDAYNEVWERIFDQNEDRQTIARTALTWITYAKERLTVDMLLRAIALSLEPDIARIEEEDLIDVELLLSSCVGLVILNEEDGVIRLVHYTTQDYLEWQLAKVEANTSIARVCLMCFGLEGLRKIPEAEYTPFPVTSWDMPPSFSPPPPPPPPLPPFETPIPSPAPVRQMNLKSTELLAGYAGSYWGVHAREGREEDLEELILSTLLTEDIRHRIDLYDFAFRFPGAGIGDSRLSLLHLVSRYGLSRICSKLLKNGTLSTPPQLPV